MRTTKESRIEILDQQIYRLKTHTSGLFLFTMNLRKCININNVALFFLLKSISMCKITAVSEKKSYYVCVKLKNVKVDIMPISNICKKCVVFLTNLHSWQEFYTTAGCNSRDKFQVCNYFVSYGHVCTMFLSVEPKL